MQSSLHRQLGRLEQEFLQGTFVQPLQSTDAFSVDFLRLFELSEFQPKHQLLMPLRISFRSEDTVNFRNNCDGGAPQTRLFCISEIRWYSKIVCCCSIDFCCRRNIRGYLTCRSRSLANNTLTC